VNAVFADTSYYVALLNAKDRHHLKAIDFLRHSDCDVVTTDFVLVEVGNYLRRPADRPFFLSLVDDVENDEQTTVVAATRALRDLGLDLFRRRPDKEWSLTDCISCATMHDRGLSDALTADRHFQQAGFRALLLE
jgi:predicted nucleic acid-binding protein